MNERGVAFELNKQTYQLTYTLGAHLTLRERYGSVGAMLDAFFGPDIDEKDSEEAKREKAILIVKARNYFAREAPFLIAMLASEGVKIANDEAGKEVQQPLTEGKVLLYLRPDEVENAMDSVITAITEGSRSEHKGPEQHGVRSLSLEKAQAKNAEGAAETGN